MVSPPGKNAFDHHFKNPPLHPPEKSFQRLRLRDGCFPKQQQRRIFDLCEHVVNPIIQ